MMFKTHLMLGFLVGLLAIPYFPIKNKFLFLVLVTICSSLPDMDHAKSRINRNIPLLKVFSFLFRHRGIMHSLLAALVLSILAWYYLSQDIAYAVGIGFLAHLFGDALTKNGVELFYPFSKVKIKGCIRTGGLLEKICFYLIITGAIYEIAKLYG